MPFRISKGLDHYDILLIYFITQTVGGGGVVKLWEEKADLLTHWINELMTSLFLEQRLALPGSAKAPTAGSDW